MPTCLASAGGAATQFGNRSGLCSPWSRSREVAHLVNMDIYENRKLIWIYV